MKKVILEILPITINGAIEQLDYRATLLGLIINPPDGINLAEMRNVESVFDKLENAEGGCPAFVLLEDAEHAILSTILEKAQFRVFNKGIKQMMESVLAAVRVEVEEPTNYDVAKGR